jgi:hypothetical protein
MQHISIYAWAGSLLLTSLGILSTLAGNLLTLVLCWAAFDLVEFGTLFYLTKEKEQSGRVVFAFALRFISVLLLTGAFIQSQYKSGFQNISPQAAFYLVLAAGLRLCAFPLTHPFPREQPTRRDLGTVLRMASAASIFVLLVRIANLELADKVIPYLYTLTGLAALYGGIRWYEAHDELSARPFWILATSTLSMTASIAGQPAACLTWGIACLLSGGLLFLSSFRNRTIFLILMISLINLTGLPYTPNWDAARMFFLPFTLRIPLIFLLVHVLIMLGYLRKLIRTDVVIPVQDRWIRVIYPIGLIILPMMAWIITYWSPTVLNSWRETPHPTLENWIVSILPTTLIGLIWLVSRLGIHITAASGFKLIEILNTNWLDGLLSDLYMVVHRLVTWITTILEGEGGVLWAMLLLAIFLSLILGGLLST